MNGSGEAALSAVLWLSLWAEQSCPSLVSASLVTPPKDMYIALGHLFSHRRIPLVPGSLSAVWVCEAEPSCSCVPASNHRVRPECSNVLPEHCRASLGDV